MIGLKIPASNEATLFYVSKEANLTIFFMCFLKVHLATNSDMDDYLGFYSPEAHALLGRDAKPQIGVHFRRSV